MNIHEQHFCQAVIDPRYGRKTLQNRHGPEVVNYFEWRLTGNISPVTAKNDIYLN